MLTQENYTQGFLVDEELLAGVTQHPEQPEKFVAFVLNHQTGEYLAYQTFALLPEALNILNEVQRPWKFEQSRGGCGGKGGCGGHGKGGCGGHSHDHDHDHDHDHGHSHEPDSSSR